MYTVLFVFALRVFKIVRIVCCRYDFVNDVVWYYAINKIIWVNTRLCVYRIACRLIYQIKRHLTKGESDCQPLQKQKIYTRAVILDSMCIFFICVNIRKKHKRKCHRKSNNSHNCCAYKSNKEWQSKSYFQHACIWLIFVLLNNLYIGMSGRLPCRNLLLHQFTHLLDMRTHKDTLIILEQRYCQ